MQRGFMLENCYKPFGRLLIEMKYTGKYAGCEVVNLIELAYHRAL
jgi:hypothetical protein